MQKRIGLKKWLLILAAAIVLVAGGLSARRAYEQNQLEQRLKAEETYMFQDTYMFCKDDAAGNEIYAYYMVCEPVDDKAELVEKLERLMEQKEVIEGARDYYRVKFGDKYGYDALRISVEFYKPSKKFPIGWQPLEAYSMLDYPEMSENLLVSVNVPWDSDSVDEHAYYFWWMSEPDNLMTFDVYSRETKEDGSFVLIPEVRETKEDA
ncbi:hypothetical protein SDC9_85294 [bioreactor metagenome]|uniref:Uncharacterized protein n=1 Tax=bioreactor metagenome TaxID=1076179 RepID=A0A644ZLP0_9ZZZZ